MEPLTSIVDLLNQLETYHVNPKALNMFDQGQWHSHSTSQLLQEVRFIALALNAIGLKRGEKIGLMAYPSPKWVIIDLAIMVAGGVTVPLFVNISEENFLFEVLQTEMKMLILSGKEQLQVLENHQNKFDTIILLDADSSDIGVSFQSLIQLGKEIDQQIPTLYDNLKKQISSEDLATIIYTSGSTGVPKGVEITHHGLVSLYHLENFNWDSVNDRYLSILPLAHIFGRCFNLFMVSWGVSIYYSNDIKNVGTLCQEIHPTILVFVPRLLEKIYAKMLSKVQHAGYMKRTLGLWAFELANQEEEGFFKKLMHPLADKVVYKTLRESLGGSVRIVISGGAPLNPHICHFFIDIGVSTYEGWGLTEASTISVNDLKNRKIGSVGKPLGDIEVKTSSEGELLVRGTLVMRGYYKNSEASTQAIDSDGWLHTGDKGFIDDDGFIYIQGRLKEMYKTSTGEYIAPVPIEQSLCKVPLIDMALVIGDNRKFASCLLFPDHDVLHSLRMVHMAEDQPYETFVESHFIKQEMDKLFESINQRLNHWEQLQAYRFVMAPLTVESGELTPSMKIRRDIVAQKYQHLINDMYSEEKNE